MIILANQLALQFNIGDKSDFIDIEQFQYMRIAENAGGLRPVIEVSFQVKDDSIIPYLNQGNIITLMWGIKEPTSDVLQFELVGDTKTKGYHVGSTVSLMGAMYNRGFTSKIKSHTFTNLKSFQALQAIANQNGLKFQTNVNRSNDKQNWYQSGMTDWQMFEYISNRAYKDNNTFFSFGFDNTNLFFYDMTQLLKSGPKWILTTRGLSKNENDRIVNIGSYQTTNAYAGQNADLAGKNVTTIGYNLDTGEISNPKYNLKSLCTMDTRNINVNSTGCQNYEYMITTGDEHSFCMEALNQNKRNNILFSSYCCYVPIPGQYKDFRLLDPVQLIPADDDKEAQGLYFISGIVRQYSDRQYKTILTLNRESGNGIKGNLEFGG